MAQLNLNAGTKKTQVSEKKQVMVAVFNTVVMNMLGAAEVDADRTARNINEKTLLWKIFLTKCLIYLRFRSNKLIVSRGQKFRLVPLVRYKLPKKNHKSKFFVTLFIITVVVSRVSEKIVDLRLN